METCGGGGSESVEDSFDNEDWSGGDLVVHLQEFWLDGAEFENIGNGGSGVKEVFVLDVADEWVQILSNEGFVFVDVFGDFDGVGGDSSQLVGDFCDLIFHDFAVGIRVHSGDDLREGGESRNDFLVGQFGNGGFEFRNKGNFGSHAHFQLVVRYFSLIDKSVQEIQQFFNIVNGLLLNHLNGEILGKWQEILDLEVLEIDLAFCEVG